MTWEALVLQELGPLALLMVFALWIVRQIINGKLIPRSTYEDRMADKDQEIGRLLETIDTQAHTNREALEAAKLAADMLQAIRGRSGRDVHEARD